MVTTKVALYRVGIGNTGNAVAENATATVYVARATFGVHVAWADLSTRTPVIHTTDSMIPDSPDGIAELLWKEYFSQKTDYTDRERKFVHREFSHALIFFSVEGGKSLFMPTTLKNVAPIPYRNRFGIGVTGDFKTTPILWQAILNIKSWNDNTALESGLAP